MRIIMYLLVVFFGFVPGFTQAATVLGFNGETVRLELFAQDTTNLIQRFDSVVCAGLEFGQEGGVFLPVVGGAMDEGLEIDMTNNSIFFDFRHTGANTFIEGTFTGYIFSDLFGTIPSIVNVSIDTDSTTLGIDDTCIFFNDDQIFVNMESLPYNPGLTAKLDINFVPIPGSAILFLSGLIPLFTLIRRINGVSL